ncbi:MAG: efflux RND transporter periplasmic adaptor subunit [Myxococcota bacterium]
MSWTFRILTLILAVALGIGATAMMRPQPVQVDVATVQRGLLEQKVVDDGRARVRERYTVSTPVTGTLARLELVEGDLVEPGAVLARLLPLASPLLDPESRRAAEDRLASVIDASQQAQASAARAELAADQSRRDLSRVEALAKGGAVASAELDQATVNLKIREAEAASAGFAAKVAAHEIEQARAALRRFTPGAGKAEQFVINAPVRGQVLHVLHKSEGVVTAGTALLELGDPGALELVADVLSQDAVSIRPGMTARVLHWGGENPLSAKVRRVEPAAYTKTSALGVEEQRVNVVLDPGGAPEAWRALGDGFALEIEITTWSKPDALKVPTSALFRRGAEWFVFSVDDGHARARAVKLGHRGPLEAEIESGLEAGAVVVVHPGAGVQEGTSVAYRL